jgi:ATP-binding protein involved in chromosome partitioning
MTDRNTPREIKRMESKGLRVTWQDGSIQELTSEVLRKRCPCAECREIRGDESHAKPLTGKKRTLAIVQNTIDEELALEEIWGVGQYAIGIRWADGHSSGIYTFGYLRELGQS